VSAAVAALGGWGRHRATGRHRRPGCAGQCRVVGGVAAFRGQPVFRPGSRGRDGACARIRPYHPPGRWPGIDPASWSSSLDQREFEAGVESNPSEPSSTAACTRSTSPGDCRPPLPADADPFALAQRSRGCSPSAIPPPHAGHLVLPSHGVAVVSASPERFLRRDGRTVLSEPIKGTVAQPSDGGLPVRFGEKDRAENVMIVDLVRNDLGRVCEPGSVTVPSLFRQELPARAGTPGVRCPGPAGGRVRPGPSCWTRPSHRAASRVRRSSPLATSSRISSRCPRGPYCGRWAGSTPTGGWAI